MNIVPHGYICPPLKAVAHTDPESRAWCGPAVISAVSGWTVEDAKRWLWERRGRQGTTKGIRGTWVSEIRAALAAAGLGTHRVDVGCDMTLAAWLRSRSPEVRRATCIVTVGHHFVAVKGYKLVDSWTKEPVFIRKAPHRRKRVSHAFVVYKRKAKHIKGYEPTFTL